MAVRETGETGFYHVVVRSAGKVALFEDDADRRRYLKLLKAARDATGVRIIAWVLMTDHVHLVLDVGELPTRMADFMYYVDARYSRYFNAKTGREGTLFQGDFWSKPIRDDAQLVATVYYIHMNPEAAGIAPMRAYHWSSYQEYAGIRWMVDTSVVLDYFGGFEAFDAYTGSSIDAATSASDDKKAQDGDVLQAAMAIAGVTSSGELRGLCKAERNDLIRVLGSRGVSCRRIARTFGIGPSTVSRVLRSK